jgi:hypothetical protein
MHSPIDRRHTRRRALWLLVIVCLAGTTAAPTLADADHHEVTIVEQATVRRSPSAHRRPRRLPLTRSRRGPARAARGTRSRFARLLVGHRRRRVTDVGDDWRALLLGAPPTLA